MQLSKNTTDVLKNFASINQGIIVRKGNVLRTCSVAKNIVAEATIDEKFDQDFAIYDLNEFLSTCGLFKDPALKFSEKALVIGDSNAKSKANYYYCDESVVVAPPAKSLTLPTVEVEFTLTAENLNAILKACSILQAPDVSIRGEGKTLELVATDLTNPTANSYAITLAEDYSGPKCNFIVKAANLKMIPDNYKVKISKSLILSMTSAAAGDLQYWIALEKASTCEA